MKFADEIYETLTDDEDARVCKDIPDEACRETPSSFVQCDRVRQRAESAVPLPLPLQSV